MSEEQRKELAARLSFLADEVRWCKDKQRLIDLSFEVQAVGLELRGEQ